MVKQMTVGFLEMVKIMMLIYEQEHSLTAHQGVNYIVAKISIVGLVNDTDKGIV